MIKVLNVISDSNIGGAGRVLINYLENCDREEFRTMIALPKGSLLAEPLRQLGGEVYELDGLAERSYSKEDVKLLEALIRELKPDIVHTHGALSGRIAGRRCGCKVVYTRHSAFPVPAKLKYPPGRWVNKLVNEHYADHIIAVSPAAAENLTDAGISPKLITVMMNGVSAVERRPAEETASLRSRLGIAPEDFVLGILARIEPYKGHLHIIEALDMLRGRGRKPVLLIAGSGSYEEELKSEVRSRGLQDQVQFLGFWGDVAPFLSALDLQLNASYGTETSSLSVLEGLSMGLPAVVSSYGGNPWLIDDEEDGLIFKNRDSADLAAKIERLMDSPEELARMGERAKEIFQQRFTGKIFAGNVEKVYREVLEGSKNG
jgi:glycosyltransferase involved in cell wall biosynthesis